MEQNFDAFISLVWPENGDYDSPKQGYHVTPGDSGGGTYGGVIEATWSHYVAVGLVRGTLRGASEADLRAVLRVAAWGSVCDQLPTGLDVLVANGRMMTGHYGALLQQSLGLVGDDVDGDLGPYTIKAANDFPSVAGLMLSLNGAHYAYLKGLSSWPEFGKGWARRLADALRVSSALLQAPN